MDDALRHTLWNCMFVLIFSNLEVINNTGQDSLQSFLDRIWLNFFKLPLDSVSRAKGADFLRDRFYKMTWFEVYDFIEFVVNDASFTYMADPFNRVLTRENSAYRFISGSLTEITDEEELRALEEALEDDRFSGVRQHLRTSLELLSDKKSPDYRNSIKESISAVEGIARIVSQKPGASLGDAIKAIERNGNLHQAFKDGILKLYGYTSDAQGIRHAMLDEPHLGYEDAKFFLVICTAFVNYLKTQLPPLSS